MKLMRWITCLAVLTAVYPQPPASNQNCTLTIKVTGLRNDKGGVGGTIFSSDEGWPEKNDKAVAHATFPITGNTATLTFNNLAPGAYGVAILHDENKNKKMDRNFIGFPKEGFGFANNPRVGLSAPKMSVAMVKVEGPETTIEIHMIYK